MESAGGCSLALVSVKFHPVWQVEHLPAPSKTSFPRCAVAGGAGDHLVQLQGVRPLRFIAEGFEAEDLPALRHEGRVVLRSRR